MYGTIRKLPETVASLCIRDRTECTQCHAGFTAGTVYPARLKYRRGTQYEDGESYEFLETVIIVCESKDYTLEEFVKYYKVPNIPSLKDSEHYPTTIEYAKTIFKTFGLKNYDFQITDLAMLALMDRGILAYEQGMGKTVMALAWSIIKKFTNDCKKFLFIVQQDLIQQWEEEAKRFNIHFKLLSQSSSVADGYYITHYEYLSKEAYRFTNSFDLIVPDEGHKIKTGESIRSKAVRSLNAKCKMILSGTPIKNIVEDLHYLIGWTVGFKSPNYRYGEDEQEKFRHDYGVYRSCGYRRRIVPKVSDLARLQLLLAPIMLRREITDTGVKLVNKKIYEVFVKFTTEQKIEYDNIINSEIDHTTKLYKLRLNTTTYPDNEKLKMLEFIVWNKLRAGQQVIIYTGLVPAGELYLEIFGSYARLVNGNTRPVHRAGIISEFKQGKFPILIAGIEAVNSGHSLQNASNVIVTDYSWTASTFDQAVARVYRINSERDVNIYVLITDGSYDESMRKLIKMKREASELVLDNHYSFETIIVKEGITI